MIEYVNIFEGVGLVEMLTFADMRGGRGTTENKTKCPHSR